MPKNAATHIQNTAPGPPVMMAADTPAMLPTPTVAARAVQRAWNCEIDAFSFVCEITFLSKRLPIVFFHQCPKCVIWKKSVNAVMSIPVPIRRMIPILTHTNSLITSLMFAKDSQNDKSINTLLNANGLFYTDRYIYGNTLFLHFTFDFLPLTAFSGTGQKAFDSMRPQRR